MLHTIAPVTNSKSHDIDSILSIPLGTESILSMVYLSRDEAEREKAKRAVNTANFGYLSAKHGGHFCICEIPGQAPCPGKVEVPRKEHAWHNKETESSE